MYAKIVSGAVVKFPYTIGDLKKDHPNVSFPRVVSINTLRSYNVFTVVEGNKPDESEAGVYQKVQRDAEPVEVNGRWQINYSVVDRFSDNTDAQGNVVTKSEREQEYQELLDTQASATNRQVRDQLLAETDYLALSDSLLTEGMTTYRQALRDITDHDNFPHLTDEDWPVKP